MKVLLLFLLLVTSCLCCSSTDNLEWDSPTVPYAITRPFNRVPALPYPKVEVLSVQTTVTKEVQMVEMAAIFANTVLASDCFKESLLTAELTETKKLTNQGVYDYLRFEPIQIHIIMFTGTTVENKVSQVIGFFRTSEPSNIYQNRYFVKNTSQSASNMLHESTHVLGFDHLGVFRTSVPYQMNTIFKKCSVYLGIAKPNDFLFM
jgi:hypothetical protein